MLTPRRRHVLRPGRLLSLVIVFFAGLGLTACGIFTDSTAYQTALQRAQDSAAVQAALGTPIEADWWVTGTLEQHGSMESAQLQIPIHGPQASGTLYVDARGVGDELTFYILSVEVGDQIIDLTDDE